MPRNDARSVCSDSEPDRVPISPALSHRVQRVPRASRRHLYDAEHRFELVSAQGITFIFAEAARVCQMVPVADEAALRSAVAFVSSMALSESVGIWVDAQHAMAEWLASHLFCAAAVDGHVVLTVLGGEAFFVAADAHSADQILCAHSIVTLSPTLVRQHHLYADSYTDTGSPNAFTDHQRRHRRRHGHQQRGSL